MAERARGGSLPKSNSKLTRWRLRRGVTQSDLARAVGIDAKVYRKIEQRARMPRFDVLVNCAIALRVSLDDIVEDEWRLWQTLDQRALAPPDPDEFWATDADRTHMVPPGQAVQLLP